MKNRKILKMICTIAIIAFCGTIGFIGYNSLNKEKNDTNKNYEVLEVNHIAVAAYDYEIENVEMTKKVKKEFKDKVPVYKVKVKEYSEKDIKQVVKNTINCAIESIEEDNDIHYYELKNGGYITYYENSGTISYKLIEDYEQCSDEIISNDKLIEKANEFVKSSKLYDIKDLHIHKVGPSIIVRSSESDKEEVLGYEVMYVMNPPEGIDGFDGTGPGIIVNYNAYGELVGFVSIKKEIELTDMMYPAKEVVDIKSDIIENNNVMIYSTEDVGNSVELKELENVLYCDSIGEKQEYMIPHYRLSDEDNNELEIVLPAIDNEYLKIK